MTNIKTSNMQFLSLLFIGTFSVVALLAPFTFLPPEIVADSQKKEIDKEKKSSTTLVKVIQELPMHDVILPDFGNIRDVRQKKRAFFDFIRPSITRENQLVLALREQVKILQAKIQTDEMLTEEEKLQFSSLNKNYRINKKYTRKEKASALLHRIDIVPMELVMVQAANESAWGTSRFAKIGLNFFGIWCFREGCGMIPNGRNVGGDHEVMAFKTVDASVKRYLYNINTNRAYYAFREIRHQLRTEQLPLYPDVLAAGLIHYSERKGDYVVDILKMLKHNKRYF